MTHTRRIIHTLLLICLLLLLLSRTQGEETIAEKTPEVSSGEKPRLNPMDIENLGSDPLEFSFPGEIKWNEVKQKFFIVDEGNKRIHFLSEFWTMWMKLMYPALPLKGTGALFLCYG